MRTLLASLAVIFSLQASIRSDYTPGTPGAPWTQWELLKTRAKLWRLYSNNDDIVDWTKSGQFDISDITGEMHSWEAELGFFPAKVLRLSFHDCVRYANGDGGCDGCLNWHGVGTRFDKGALEKQFLEDDITEGNNNGLEYVVAVLEELYTNPAFPSGAPELSESLRSSGKSRADLWSYAAKVAVEFAVEQNNFQCKDNPSDWTGSHVGKATDCMRNKGEADCESKLPREIKFKYGRSDCVSEDTKFQYKASQPEKHPNPNGNGDDTLDFFHSEFGFSGRETVAIMGAHTLGKMYPSHSLLKYTWTSQGGHLFNNAYYKNFVNKEDWFIQGYDDTCTLLGDAYGTKPDVKWFPTVNGFTKSGGPMQWFRKHFACTYCGKKYTKNSGMEKEFDECCPGPDGLACVPDGKERNPKQDLRGCEKYRQAFSLIEVAMNCEMGLYLQFDVENGIPKNCPGLEDFTTENFPIGNRTVALDVNCPLNMRSDDGDSPVSSIMAEYAADQDKWIKDYIKAFEKMMQNGYEQSDLTEAPSSFWNVQCQEDENKEIDCKFGS